GTLLATTSVSSASIQCTNSTITNAVHTALSTGTLNVNSVVATDNVFIDNPRGYLKLGSVSTDPSETCAIYVGTTVITGGNFAQQVRGNYIQFNVDNADETGAFYMSSFTNYASSFGNLRISDYNGVTYLSFGMDNPQVNIPSVSSTTANIANAIITTSTLGSVSFSGDLTVSGDTNTLDLHVNTDLTVTGSVITNTLAVKSNVIVLNSIPTGLVDGGMLIRRYVSGTAGSMNYAAVFYREETDEFTLALTTSDPGASPINVDTFLPLRAASATYTSTAAASGTGSGGSLTVLGGAAISKNLIIGDGLTTGTLYATTGLTTGTARITNSLCTAITTGTLLATTSVSTPNAVITNSSTGTLTATAITTGTLIATTSVSTANAIVTNSTMTNILCTAITTGTLIATTGVNAVNCTISNAVHTALSTGTLTATAITTGSLNANTGTFSTVGTSWLSAATFTGGNVSLSGNLSVAGTLTVVNITATNLLDTNITAGIANVTTSFSAIGNANTLGSIFTTGGNVGIGTTSPAYKLDISGSVRATTSITTASVYSGNITSTNIVATNLSSGTILSNSSFAATFNSNTLGNIFTTGGNVGIGTTSPGYSLQVNGQIYASGDITALSDRRIKKNITPLKNALSKIKNLTGVTYNRKDKCDDNVYIGMIAQELETEYPELIYTDGDLKSVAYGNMTAVLLEA
ncbi:tail fiber domain-containing protein, partial [bacterium]|nr:tail fiber domain-containing protein [bacterium]